MDEALQELERAYLADPKDNKALVAWYQASVRAGWTHEGKTLADWTADLGKARARSALMQSAEDIGPRIIPALTALLDDKRAPVRGAALEALQILSAWAQGALEPARRILTKDRAVSNRRAAVRLLGSLGPEAGAATPELLRCLDHKDAMFKRETVTAITQIGPGAAAARDKLADLVTGDDDWFVPAVLEAIEAIGVDVALIPTLEAVFERGHRMSREVAIRMARALGDDGRALTTWILGQLRDVDRNEEDYSHEFRIEAIKFAAAHAEADPQMIPAIYDAIRDPVPEVRAAAAVTLAKTAQAADLVKRLLEDLASDEAIERNRAAEALGNMAPASTKAALTPLIKALDDANHWVVSRAAEALGKLGPAAKAAVPKLKTIAKGKRKLNREFAEWALGEIGA